MVRSPGKNNSLSAFYHDTEMRKKFKAALVRRKAHATMPLMTSP
jgi:hypothetical protein